MRGVSARHGHRGLLPCSGAPRQSLSFASSLVVFPVELKAGLTFSLSRFHSWTEFHLPARPPSLCHGSRRAPGHRLPPPSQHLLPSCSLLLPAGGRAGGRGRCGDAARRGTVSSEGAALQATPPARHLLLSGLQRLH